MTRMKESGIDWIGQIPEEWVISKIKFTTQLNGRIGWQGLTSAEYKEEGPYLITGTDFYNGAINFETAVHIDEKRWSEASQIQVENGDLLITKDGTVGKVAIISGLDDKASLNSGVLRIQPVDEIDRKFLYLVLLSDEFWMWFNYTNSGASTILHLYQNVFDEFTFTFPSKNEQQKIADFLDKKTAQLDKVKALLEEQIQKLKDYRASLIYETVTKGLDKNVPMKDSGIDWIGQVPEGWEISKIRYLVTTRSEKRITDSSIPYIGLENIESQTGKFVETGIQVDKSENIVVEIGDVLFGKLRPYLRKYWRATFPSTASSEFLVFQSSELDMNFLYYAIQSDSFIEEVNTSTYGSKMPRASWEYIKNMKITFPSSLVEQQKIANLLDEKTAQIDNLIQIKNQQIKNINKQRQTLIYDYVTGKRRV